MLEKKREGGGSFDMVVGMEERVNPFDLAVQQWNVESGQWFGLVPASIGMEVGAQEKFYRDKRLVWWTDDAFFKYPVGLVSSFDYITSSSQVSLREVLKLGNQSNFFLFLDSGGFQLLSLEEGLRKSGKDVSYSARQALEFMILQSANVGFVLDYPATYLDRADFDFFKQKAVRVRDNNLSYLEVLGGLEGKEILVYNILQGFGLSELEFWYDTVDVEGFDGWACTPKVGWSVLDYVGSLGYLYERGLRKNCHILGSGSFDTCAFVAYVGSKYIKNLTFDSTTPGMGAKYRNYYSFSVSGRSESRIFGRKFDGLSGGMLSCSCPVCSYLHSSEEFEKEGVIGARLVSLHNLYQFVFAFGYFLGILKNDGEDKFREVVKKVCSNDVLIAMDYFDCVVRDGYEQATKLFSISFRKVVRGRSFSFSDLIYEKEEESEVVKNRRKIDFSFENNFVDNTVRKSLVRSNLFVRRGESKDGLVCFRQSLYNGEVCDSICPLVFECSRSI